MNVMVEIQSTLGWGLGNCQWSIVTWVNWDCNLAHCCSYADHTV